MAHLKLIPSSMSDILATYSSIPKETQIQHVTSVRDAAYRTKRYPCLGRFRFLVLDLSTHPLYRTTVLPWLTSTASDQASSPVFLDLGTCLGQDVRKLIYDGAPVSRVWGADIESSFIEAGYDLFCDRDKLPRERFICPANVLDLSPNNKLSALDGKVDVLHVTAVFHLFNLDEQRVAAERCLRLLRRDGTLKRALLLGKQVGNVEAGVFAGMGGGERYRHDKESWRRLWEEATRKDEWKDIVKSVQVDVEMKERYVSSVMIEETPESALPTGEGFRWMIWSVWVNFNG